MSLKHRHNFESVAEQLKAGEKHYSQIKFAGKLSCAVIYPNLYSLGMSNLGFLTVHRLVGSMPGIGIERFFPALLADSPLNPPFYSFETGRPLGDFNVLMFSFSFEGDFDKIPGIFAALGMPVIASERSNRHPILIAGGAAVASNSAALSLIFDIIVPGEAESTIVPIITTLNDKGFDKEAIAQIDNVWVPSLSKTYLPAKAYHDVNASPAYSHIVSEKNAFGGAHIIEVMRGCPRVCSFCLARAIYSPPRAVSLQTIEQWLDAHADCTDLGLVAPSLFDHPEVEELFKMLTERNIRIRNSSVKWEKITPTIIESLRKSNITGLTIAPETGSERLRKEMRKPMDEGRFLNKINELFDNGFEHIKMYFVSCLPGETDSDTAATIDLIEKVLKIAPSYRSVSATFSVFVPKNHTEWSEQTAPEQYEIKKRTKYIKSMLQKLPGQFKANFESPNEALRQAYLSKVGPELADEYAREAKECRLNQLFSKNQFSALEF
ncbi:MAG: B12-binding domain-containing radical SAM protein [Candidatus Ozemobacteraceae bacterium]|jgi:radical SAM superfamily enzyme YgiQ (UPF0313 family)